MEKKSSGIPTKRDIDAYVSRVDIEGLINLWLLASSIKDEKVKEWITNSIPELNHNLRLNAKTFPELVLAYDQKEVDYLLRYDHNTLINRMIKTITKIIHILYLQYIT